MSAEDSLAVEMETEVEALARAAFQYARTGHGTRLVRLVAAGVPVNLCNERGDTLLMLSSYNGHVEATRLLLELHADPDRANDRGQSPLLGAAFKGNTEIARLLLDHGAQVDAAGPDGKTALMFAAMFDRTEVIGLLLSRGARLELQDAEGRTALDYSRAMEAQRAAELLGRLHAG